MLLDDYKKAKAKYYKKVAEFDAILNPLKKKYYDLEDRVEKYIITHKLYLPMEELKKYNGTAEDISVIVGNKIEDFDFAGYYITDGILSCGGYENQYEHLEGNEYGYNDQEYGITSTVELKGFFNLNLGDGIIPETSIEYLWKMKS